MRTFSCLSILIASIAACGTTDSGTVDPDPGDATPVGAPIGDPVTMTIGPSGGTLMSADGALTVTVPAGAIAADTAFAIQPVANTSFDPVGGAYSLSPADVAFAQPVTLAFTYTDAAIAGGSSDEIVLAAQDSSGYWHGELGGTMDATAKSLTLAVTSFGVASQGGVAARIAPAGPPPGTAWTVEHTIRITPTSATVPVSKTASFVVQTCFRLDSNGDLADNDAVMKTCVPLPATGVGFTWMVNSEAGGNSLVGKVAGAATGTYTAPKNVWKLPVRVGVSVAFMHKSEYSEAIVTIVCANGKLRADGGTCSPETWSGTSHITGDDGAVYDSTFVFAQDPSTMQPRYIVQSGQVNITIQPPSSGDCVTTIEASHPIAPTDGRLTVDETDFDNPTVTGGGTTVWVATYTIVCPDQTTTEMLPYSIAWWPAPVQGNSPVTAPNGMTSISASGVGGSGTVTLQRSGG